MSNNTEKFLGANAKLNTAVSPHNRADGFEDGFDDMLDIIEETKKPEEVEELLDRYDIPTNALKKDKFNKRSFPKRRERNKERIVGKGNQRILVKDEAA